MKPTLEELIKKLEKKFGKLNPQAEHCAEDFHSNYEDFIDSIRSRDIIIVASTNMLADKLQESKYTKYRIFGGLFMLLFIAGIITIFFNWEIGLGLIILAFISKKTSSYLKSKISKNFTKDITLKFSKNSDEAMFDICQYYIAGILQLASKKGKANLPFIPSYSLTGNQEFARDK